MSVTVSPTEFAVDEGDLERALRARERRAGYRAAAQRALAFARLYRAEEGAAGGMRECACVAQAREYRNLALRERTARDGVAAPGLARTRPSTVAPARKIA
jgi:hypothetical protein